MNLSGRCRHCGRTVGLFKEAHPECEDHFKQVKQAVLNDAARGLVPQRFTDGSGQATALARGEALVWAFAPVHYSELQRQRGWGHSYGLSTRVARGAYISQRIYQPPSYEYVFRATDQGLLTITDQAVHFKGDLGSIFAFPYGDIDDVAGFPDGFGVHVRSRSTKPQRHRFACRDGDFAAELVWRLWQAATRP